MDLRAPVDRCLLLGLGIPVHRGERSDAEARDLRAREHRGLNVHHHALGAGHQEFEGADDRGTFHQSVERDRVANARLDIEVGEVGKLLRPVGDRNIERDPSRRQAILPQFADRAEIGRAEKGDPVVLMPIQRSIARFLNAQAGEANPFRQIVRRRIGRHVEIGLVVNDLARVAALDDMHPDRLLEKQTEMEEGHRKPARSVGEQCVIVAVADFSPLLVIDLLQHLLRRTSGGRVWRMGLVARLRLEKIVSERDRGIELQSVRLGPQRFGKRIHRRGGRGGALQQCAAIYAFGHQDLFDRTLCLRDFPSRRIRIFLTDARK